MNRRLPVSLIILLALGYPFLSGWLMGQGYGRAVLLLFACLTLGRALRAGAPARRWIHGGSAILLALGAVYSEAFTARLIPALVYASLAWLFGHTLAHPPSLIERLVRLQFPEFQPGIADYLYRLTQIWTAFFAASAAVCVLLAAYADERLWTLYTGVIVYLLMGGLALGEMIYRPIRFPDLEIPHPVDSLKVMMRDGHKVFRELRG
ncbi:hypothetical protein [Methylococcus sp. EFPC2]|uniref:COG4648 family protein n=1 Tax=Methylococcus sp. EFPC2 TaxID=2812648 RepID=UPI0019678C10|nr:hypothetical protein [Methylococcus sp. EFPC2]QSA98864.1 hypothetical protein JWZ97_08860 [Methylococcus sp. EFPC2]